MTQIDIDSTMPVTSKLSWRPVGGDLQLPSAVRTVVDEKVVDIDALHKELDALQITYSSVPLRSEPATRNMMIAGDENIRKLVAAGVDVMGDARVPHADIIV